MCMYTYIKQCKCRYMHMSLRHTSMLTCLHVACMYHTTHILFIIAHYTCTHADSYMHVHTHIPYISNRFQIEGHCRSYIFTCVLFDLSQLELGVTATEL